MDEQQNININNESQNNNIANRIGAPPQRNYFLIAVLFLAASLAYGLWIWQSVTKEETAKDYITASRPKTQTRTDEISANDTTAAINNDLDNIDLTDLDAEFQEIDADLNSL